MNAYPPTWASLLPWLSQNTPGIVFKMLPHQIQHPKDAGMIVAVDVPLGQRSTYRMLITADRDLVVRDFTTYYEAFVELRPTASGIEKALTDSPGTSVAGMVAAGALLGLMFGRSTNAALTGAALGGLAGLAGVGVANARTSPQNSRVAEDLLKLMSEMVIRPDDPRANPKPVATPPSRKMLPEAVEADVAPRKPRHRKKVSRTKLR